MRRLTSCVCGGAFAKFANIEFAASPEQALAYLKVIRVPRYFEYGLDAEQSYVYWSYG